MPFLQVQDLERRCLLKVSALARCLPFARSALVLGMVTSAGSSVVSACPRGTYHVLWETGINQIVTRTKDCSKGDKCHAEMDMGLEVLWQWGWRGVGNNSDC